ncbi:MAG: polysaccharide lyase 6 family protein [Saprospiraceae bacterium]
MKPNLHFFIFLSLLHFLSCSTTQTSVVKNNDELISAIKAAKPGTEIILQNGVWKDIEIDFYGTGSALEPITLKAQEKGKVFIEGSSNLMLSGTHLVVEGLVFRNGFTPVSEVISFRKSKDELCTECRVTECVIDNFNNPERFEDDLWVAIYGKKNRFDHNQLTGKRNQGVTLAVRLNTKESIENFHSIDSNYFGPRPVLGSNGGETIRIGTSHYSMSNSNTLVEGNFFDRCNGEHEIISNKSCQNTFRNNTFFECQGTLTMRHGNETLVENNYFFGNGKPNIGGIRIINERQTVKNNYCEGLTGYRFRGALVIMNGVPNSPINRYFPVIDSKASNNSFYNCDYIQFCAGSDDERSAVPTSTVVNDNIFTNEIKSDIFTIYDDISGITFENNIVGLNIDNFQEKGFQKQSIKLKRVDGILQPVDNVAAGAKMLNPAGRPSKDNTGTTWYPKHEEDLAFRNGAVHKITPTNNDIFEIIKNAGSGDIIEIASGSYTVRKSINITKPLTIKGIGSTKSEIKIYFEKSSLFNIGNGGALELENLTISGAESPDKPGNAVIRTSRYSMVHNYSVSLNNCDFIDMKVNHTFNVLDVYKNTFADSIVVKNCNFSDISGSVFTLDKEYEDLGIYNVEHMVLENCNFSNVEGSAINLYRGGGDESTFGPTLIVSSCHFTNVGNGSKNKTNAALKIYGVQFADFRNNKFEKSKAIDMFLTVGDPVIMFSNNTFIESDKIRSNSDKYRFQ